MKKNEVHIKFRFRMACSQLTKNLKRFREQFKKYGQGEKYLLKEIPNYYDYFDRTEEIQTNINGL